MKNKNKFLAFLLALMLIVPVTNINAASFGVWASAYTVSPGQSFTVGVSVEGEGKFTASVSNGSGGGSFWGPAESVTVTAGNSGSVTITITAVDASTPSLEPIVGSQTITVNISSGNGGNNGGNTGGGDTGGNQGTYEPEIPFGETEEEKAAREEREAEEKREAELKVAFIESITVTSDEETNKGKELGSITTEDEKLEYSYDLPLFVNKVNLDVKAASDEVTLDFEKSHDVSAKKEVIIKASKGDMTQEYKVSLNPYDKEANKVEDGFVYQDEQLTKAFKELGFEAKEYELDGNKLTMFNKNAMFLQMVVDENQEALFYRLDEKGTLLDKGQVVVHEKDLLFVESDVEEDLKDSKLYGNMTEKVELPKPQFMNDIDENLKLKPITSGWTFEDGSIVSGLNDALDQDLYSVVAEQPFKVAVVAFDGESSPTLVYVLIASLVALILVSIGFIVYYLKSKKRIQTLLNRN